MSEQKTDYEDSEFFQESDNSDLEVEDSEEEDSEQSEEMSDDSEEEESEEEKSEEEKSEEEESEEGESEEEKSEDSEEETSEDSEEEESEEEKSEDSEEETSEDSEEEKSEDSEEEESEDSEEEKSEEEESEDSEEEKSEEEESEDSEEETSVDSEEEKSEDSEEEKSEDSEEEKSEEENTGRKDSNWKDDILVVDVLLDKSLLTKHRLGNTRVPRSKAGKATLAADLAHKLNEQIFQSNHSDILASGKYGSGAKGKLLREKNFDTVAVSISKDGRKITIAGNVKKRTDWRNRFWHPSEYGLHENQHKNVIASVIKDHYPELKNSKIDVVRPKSPPKTAEGNAQFHAEQQLLSFIGEVSDNPIGVNKPPCQKCVEVLDKVGVLSKGKEGESLAKDKVKNWKDPKPDEVEHGFNVRNKKITFDHNLHGSKEGFQQFLKGITNISVPPQVPKNANVTKKIMSHAKNHLTVNVKPQVGVSAGSGLENIINNVTETKGRAHAELGHASKGSYKTKCSTGVYAKASTAEASASWNVFSASANGPAVSAGLHSGVGTWAAGYANAELARAEAVAGPVSIGVGLNANTGASIGLDGVSASVLGFGFSVGPKMSIRTPVADVSCCIV